MAFFRSDIVRTRHQSFLRVGLGKVYPRHLSTERDVDTIHYGFGSSFHIGSGSMKLMAVPKKKTSLHKRGIRNGPKAYIARFVGESSYLIFSAAMGLVHHR